MSDYANMRDLLSSALASRQELVTVRADELAQLFVERDDLRAAPVKKSRAKKAEPLTTADMPAWMPFEAWNAFLAMRVKIKKPATDYAQTLLVKKLAAFYANDLDPGVILNQSIVNGWQDLYAPKEASTAYRSGAGAARSPRAPAPETDDDRAARRSRWGIPDMEGAPDAV